MSDQNNRQEEVESYVRISEIAKYLKWSRTKIYYWLPRCPDIEVIQMAGFRMVNMKDLPRVLMRLKQVRDEALAKQRGDG